jgi:c-di-GMP-binding flagellar brake protein YcgR
MDVRRAERVQVALAARAQLGAGTVEVQLRDLSATGAMVSAPEELGQVDSVVNLSFELTFGEITRQLTTNATIRNASPAVRTEAGSQVFRCGVQFQDLSEADRIFVRGFVFEQLASRGAVTALFAPGG